MINLNSVADSIYQLIEIEQQSNHTGLEGLLEKRSRRAKIHDHIDHIEGELQAIRSSLSKLPHLPSESVVRRAQALLSMPNIAFMEIDTTGLDVNDEMTRFMLLDPQCGIVEDILIRTNARLGKEASEISGVTREMLDEQGVDINDAWPRIQAALAGKYVISFYQDWDIKQLTKMASRYSLEPLTVIGECLRRLAKEYYNEQYSVPLDAYCERVGYTVPKPPHQTAKNRCVAQLRLIEGIVNAVMRPVV